jgi:L-aminopeptidase/D-esterase-like protein
MKTTHSITDVPGIRLGHAQDPQALTGCSVILFDRPATAGVDQRGGAPGTRETDLLRPMHLVQQIHALFLTGGSAFGLDATAGVVRYLEERGIGFDTGVAKVPIVPAAVIFDLAVGSASVRPDASMAYQACLDAERDAATAGGNRSRGRIGAGSGATVGKILGMEHAMPGGIGSASLELARGIWVGALVVVNALGDVIDPASGRIIAGARSLDSQAKTGEAGYFADTLGVMQSLLQEQKPGLEFNDQTILGNTTLGVVATNASLTKEEANKVAQMAQDGLGRAIRPAHTMLDGDTIFAVSTGSCKADVNTIGAFAAELMAIAIVNAVKDIL